MIAPKIHDLQRLFEKGLLGQLHEENMRLARATKKQKEKHRDRRGRLQRLQRHLRERSPMSLKKKRSMNFRSMSLRVGRKLRGFSRGSQLSPYMVEKLISRDGFADDEWCWCSKCPAC